MLEPAQVLMQVHVQAHMLEPVDLIPTTAMGVVKVVMDANLNTVVSAAHMANAIVMVQHLAIVIDFN